MPKRATETNAVTRTVAGQRVSVSPEDVVRKLRNAIPGPIQEHGVEVAGVIHPVKEAFAAVTGLDIGDFNTYQARSVFKQMGFRVIRRSTMSLERSLRAGGR